MKSEQPWYREEDTKENNDLARRAYDALMTVTLRKPDSLEYKKFSEEVKRRAQEEYGNFTYGEEEVRAKKQMGGGVRVWGCEGWRGGGGKKS